MRSLIISTLLLLATFRSPAQQITDYKPFSGWGFCRDNPEGVICLRKFSSGHHSFYFAVSPVSLRTMVIRSDSIFVFAFSEELIRFIYSDTPYLMALKKAEALDCRLQDAGFTRFGSNQNGIDLTIDLCPSKLPLDRIIFTDLIKEIGEVEKPVPIAVCITGRWLETHPGDLRWLDSLSSAKELSIVWINHSYNHYTYDDLPLNKNFMLASGTDIDAEVLDNEIALLEKNIVPSVFFRFPGLVSNRDVYDHILSLGLIPVGSDAWLAKGQKPGNGSIVLIHANGNEPIGVNDFINLLKTKQAEVLSGQWELFDLRESVIKDKTGRPGF
ncbi:MAG: hypothetical protein ABR974_09860 [Bacteroidales bacterium]|jgi:hypothetical protein